MSRPLSDVEQMILLAVVRVRDEAYGAAIQDVLAERAGRSVTLGSIYNTLARLEDDGLVVSEMGEPTPVRGGKAKRLYGVTEAGHAALAEAKAAFERMWAGLPQHGRGG